MKPSHSTVFRVAWVILLASVALALLPATLLARQAAGNTLHSDQASQPAALGNNPHIPLTLTLALNGFHPTLVKQWLTPADDQLPVIISLRAQPNLNQPAITSAATTLDRRTALVRELQTTAAQSQAEVLAILHGAQQLNWGE